MIRCLHMPLVFPYLVVIVLAPPHAMNLHVFLPPLSTPSHYSLLSTSYTFPPFSEKKQEEKLNLFVWSSRSNSSEATMDSQQVIVKNRMRLKRRVQAKTREQINALEDVYSENRSPSDSLMEELVLRTGITMEEIVAWFANKLSKAQHGDLMEEVRRMSVNFLPSRQNTTHPHPRISSPRDDGPCRDPLPPSSPRKPLGTKRLRVQVLPKGNYLYVYVGHGTWNSIGLIGQKRKVASVTTVVVLPTGTEFSYCKVIGPLSCSSEIVYKPYGIGWCMLVLNPTALGSSLIVRNLHHFK